MRIGVRFVLITTAALVAAVVISAVLALPPSAHQTTGQPPADLPARTIAGAFHVHSQISDGAAPRPAIARAAAAAGLKFVVFTDHGDGTRTPEAPAYIDGVLCLDGVEISTNQGHYIALGMPAAPYRLGGEASAVVEDVRRLGGFGIVAHPDSPKTELSWRDWSIDPDGIEWLNADSEWRNESATGLARAAFGYLVRPGPALARLLDRPAAALARWDALASRRRVVGFAGHDAHGGGERGVEARRRVGLPGMPSYEASFRSFSTHVILTEALAGDAASDAAAVIEALRDGRSFTAIESYAHPAWLDLSVERGGRVTGIGEPAAGDGPAAIRVRVPDVPGVSLVLLRGGSVAKTQKGSALAATLSEPGEYRVEARLEDREGSAPWIASNPIYVDLPPAAGGTAPFPLPVPVRSLLAGDWRTERDPESTAEWSRSGEAVVMTYRLAAGLVVSQFAALVVPVPPDAPAFDSVSVDLVSSSPARISVQLRTSDGAGRWGRSVYVPPEGRAVSIPVSTLLPAEDGMPPVDPRRAATVLLVVDLVNAVPGTTGQLTVRSINLARTR
jgi:hypothetical protein